MWNRKIKYVLENRQFLSLLFDQDSANCNGGKWIIRFKKAISGRFWEDLVSEAQLNSFLCRFTILFFIFFCSPWLFKYSAVIIGKTYSWMILKFRQIISVSPIATLSNFTYLGYVGLSSKNFFFLL